MSTQFAMISGAELVEKLEPSPLIWQQPPLRSSQITVLADTYERRLLDTTFRCADALSASLPVVIVTDDRAELDIRYRIQQQQHHQRRFTVLCGPDTTPVVPVSGDTLAWQWVGSQVGHEGVLVIEVPTLSGDLTTLRLLLESLRLTVDAYHVTCLVAVRDGDADTTMQRQIRSMLRATDMFVQQKS
jgi:hypothetical protein